ncbi:MAG: SirB2 family protein [Methylococcales bacterium]|nr:SirB2 family protein [Methylococcales bacterium]
MKSLHLLFVVLSLVSFLGRVAFAQFRPDMLELKWVKIAPHVLSGLLLLTGFSLAFGYTGDHGWIAAKLVALIGYVGLGILAIKRTDVTRWYAFGGALLLFVYIARVAVTKTIF